MSDDEQELRAELDETFNDFQESLGDVFVAFENLRNAGPTDDIEGLLETLEDEVKKVRTGGLLGSGARSHRRARDKWLESQKRG